jgi:PIN domain nuclease of toxin-antitoxin system
VIVTASFFDPLPSGWTGEDEMAASKTAWEISTKVRLGKLQWGNTSIAAYCESQRFDLLPVSFAHAERAGSWPQSHGDPFNRMLHLQKQ